MWQARLLYLLGCWISAIAAFEIIPLMTAIAMGEERSFAAFTASIAISLLVGGSLFLGFRGAKELRAPILTVVLPLAGFGGIGFIAGLPYFFAMPDMGLMPAAFEGISMVTTNGASAYKDVIEPDHAMSLWRAMSAWFGGFAAVVMALSLLTASNSGAMQLHMSPLAYGQSETGFARMKSIAIALIPFYTAATLACFIILMLSGTGGFDALILAMGSVSSTGITASGDHTVSGLWGVIVTGVFMVLAAYNWDYSHAYTMRKRLPAYALPGLRSMTRLIGLGALAIAAAMIMQGKSPTITDIIHYVHLSVSAVSTTGYIPEGLDLEAGHTLPVAIALILLAVVGGCVTSTSGGMKQMRMRVIWRLGKAELSRLAHPHGVNSIKLGARPVEEQDMEAIWLLIFGTTVAFIAGSLLLAILGIHFQSAISLAITSLTLSGPLIEIIDPFFPGFAGLQTLDFTILIMLMITGRVEACLFLALLARTIWRN